MARATAHYEAQKALRQPPARARCGHGNDPNECPLCQSEAALAERLENQAKFLEQTSSLMTGKMPQKLHDAMMAAMDILDEAGISKKKAPDIMAEAVTTIIRALPGDIGHQARVIKAVATIYAHPDDAGLPAPPHENPRNIKGLRKVRAGKARVFYSVEKNVFEPKKVAIVIHDILLKKDT